MKKLPTVITLSLAATAGFNSTAALAATTPLCEMQSTDITSMTQNRQISIALAESACAAQLTANISDPSTFPALANWIQECEGLPGGTWGCGVSIGLIE